MRQNCYGGKYRGAKSAFYPKVIDNVLKCEMTQLFWDIFFLFFQMAMLLWDGGSTT